MGWRRETAAFLVMGYLQNGICFETSAEAKNDFVSRVNGVEQRGEAFKQVQSMGTAEIRILFPECRTPAQTYGIFQSALLSVVVLLLALGWIKKAALI